MHCCSGTTMLFGDATTSAAVVASANDDDDNNDDALSLDNTTLLSLYEPEKTPLSSMPDHLTSEEGAGKLNGGHTSGEDLCAADGDKSLSVTFLSSSLTASGWSGYVANTAKPGRA